MYGAVIAFAGLFVAAFETTVVAAFGKNLNTGTGIKNTKASFPPVLRYDAFSSGVSRPVGATAVSGPSKIAASAATAGINSENGVTPAFLRL